jgi:hypothetical protein
MKILRQISLCGKAIICPTVYQTDRDTFIVQGYKLDGEARREVYPPEGEDAIEIPRELLEAVAKDLWHS